MNKTREQILQELENVQFLSPNEPITHWGIERIVKWLREKIEKDPKNPEHILTVWGVGYRFE